MTTILDLADDKSYQDLYLLTRLYDMPEYVKKADPAKTMQPESLQSADYADPRSCKFACHTKAAVWLSTMFFLEKQGSMPAGRRRWVAEGLKLAATNKGIENDIQALHARHEEIHKSADASLPDSDFAITWTGDDGSKERRYRLTNPLEVKTAAEWFTEHRDVFRFSDRQRIAEKILEKAAQHGVGFDAETDDLLEKQAGRGVYDPDACAEMIRNRVRACRPVPAVKEAMEKLASTIQHNPHLAHDPTSILKLAETVDTFDRNHNMAGRYTPLLPRPEDVIFCGSLKIANAFLKSACATLTGAIYDKKQFSKLSVDMLRSAFGTDLAKAVTTGILVDPEKMAEVVTTLPFPDARTFDMLMLKAGELPLQKVATARGIPDAERQAWAKSYEFESQADVEREPLLPSGMSGSRVIGRSA